MKGSSEFKDLSEAAYRVRQHILNLSTEGGCFTGASLSATDILVYLYKSFLHIPSFTSSERDYFFLSKGHDVPALYGTFVEMGMMEKERLQNHLKTNDFLYWHPNTKIPGIEFHSGSLGHLLSVSMGVALDCKQTGGKNRVVVMLGDGELNEGSVWEALLVASAFKLSNLLVLVDRNFFQANLMTEELIPLSPLEKKFSAFGCEVRTVNGHSFRDLDHNLKHFPFHPERPSVLICETVRGKGVPSLERRADRWFCNFSSEEVEALQAELDGGASAHLVTEGKTVR